MASSSSSSSSRSNRRSSNPGSKDEENTSKHSVSSAFSTTVEKIISDRDTSKRLTIRWIIMNDVPFHEASDEDFEKTIRRSFNPNFRRFSTESLKRGVMKYFKEEQEKMLSFFQILESRISLSYGIWTANLGQQYICIRAHFVDNNWAMQRRVISFTALEQDSLAKTIYSALNFCGIKRKIFSITSDSNISDNIAAAAELKGSLTLPCDGLLFHMRSICNDLKNIIQSGIDDTREAIDKISNITQHIVSSYGRRTCFLSICEKYSFKCEMLPLSIPERWDSIHQMLDTAVQYKVAINEYASLQNICGWPPSDSEWDVIKIMKEFLKTFFDAVRILSCSYQPTVINASLQIVNIIFLFNSFRSHDSFSVILNKMEAQFRKSLLPLPIILGFGILLDPRFKESGLSRIFASIYDDNDAMEEHIIYMIRIKRYFEKFYDEYYSGLQYRCVSSPKLSSSSSISSSNCESILLKIMSKPTFPSSSKLKITELDLYLNSPLASYDDPEFDTLAWWKKNDSNYPILSIMARDILAISMSTVSSYYTFEAEGCILDEDKSNLSLKIREAVMILHDLYVEAITQDTVEDLPQQEFSMLGWKSVTIDINCND